MKIEKAANVAGKKNVLSVKANNASTGKKFNSKDAEEVIAVPVEEPKAEEKPQATTNEVPTPQQENQPQEVAPSETKEIAAQTETKEVTTTQEEEKRVPTMEELKRCANTLYLLQEKHTKIQQKRADLSKFEISHENSNATIIIRDANGMEFKSSSPKTIANVLESWESDFKEAQIAVEKRLKEIFLGAA